MIAAIHRRRRNEALGRAVLLAVVLIGGGTLIVSLSIEKENGPAGQRSATGVVQRSASAASNNFTCSSGYLKSCTKAEDDGPCAVHPIISFDNGASWVQDDGRCAAREQKRCDEDAQFYSYWPTTVRVDSDMDSFWLNNEERVCQTYPDSKGRGAVVACSSGSHRDHNIPVRFWGGVDRNDVSDWKCRRESDQFVCRAID